PLNVSLSTITPASLPPIQPGGRKKIVQRFSVGSRARIAEVPQGRKRRGMAVRGRERPGMVSFATGQDFGRAEPLLPTVELKCRALLLEHIVFRPVGHRVGRAMQRRVDLAVRQLLVVGTLIEQDCPTDSVVA